MKTRLLQWSFAIVAMMIAAACSENGKADIKSLLEHLPDNADMVAAGNLKTVVESAGGRLDRSGITLPSYLDGRLPADATERIAEVNEFLANSGINTDAVAMAAYVGRPQIVFVFAIDDNDRFTAAIEREDFSESGTAEGATLYSGSENFMHIARKDGYGYLYMLQNDTDPEAARTGIARIISRAKERPFSETAFAEYITQSNALGICFSIPGLLQDEIRGMGLPTEFMHFYDGVFCLQCDLDGDTFTSRMKWFNTDGTERDYHDLWGAIDFSARISPDALAYLNADESLVGALSLSKMDWDQYMEAISDAASLPRSSRAMLSIVKGYLENIDGTVAVGFGLDNGLKSIADMSAGNNIMRQFSITFVAETKPGRAGKLLDGLESLLSLARLDYKSTTGGFTLDMPDLGGAIYAEADGDILVISNRPVAKSNDNITAGALGFKNYLAAAGLVLNHDNAIMRDLSIDNDLTVSSTTGASNFESTMKIEIKGGEKEGFLAKFFKVLIHIAEQSGAIESIVRGNSGHYNSPDLDYTADTIYIEEAAVSE